MANGEYATGRGTIKHICILFTLFFLSLLAAACAASNAPNNLKVYRAKEGSLVNPIFPTYTFEYPSAWKLQEEANHIAFASDPRLFKDLAETLQTGQILVGLSLNVNMAPQDMINSYTASLAGKIQFDPMTSVIINGHHAAYQSMTNAETGDQTFVIATEIGDNLSALLTARVARGELDLQKEALFRIMQSIAVEK